MTKTFFVTGSTGFIGTRLVERLVASGWRVKCLVRPTSKRDALVSLGVDLVEGDLDDQEALRRGVDACDGVFHCAGLTREPRPGDFERVNYEGARRVARACVETSRPRLVFLSSLAGAGTGIKNAPDATEIDAPYAPWRLRRETDLPDPVSPYGRSKRDAELALVELADELETTVLRPPYVFGEGDAASLSLFKMAKKSGIFVSPGYVDRYYSFVHVDELVDVAIAALERGERLDKTSLTSRGDGTCSGKGVYFPANSTALRFTKFGSAIARAFGRPKAFTIPIAPFGVRIAAVYSEIVKRVSRRSLPFDWNKSTEALRGPWICSNEKATKELGVALDSDLYERIERTARWYEERKLL